MIVRLHYKKNLIDFYDFVISTKDVYEDFYITKNKDRLFFTDLNRIEKILKTQEVFALYRKGIEGILLIFKEKGYRSYLKILAKNSKTEWDLLRFFSWYYFDEIFAKLKVENPLTRTLQKQNKITKRSVFGFVEKGKRGAEILLYRPKQLRKKIILGEKDDDTESNSQIKKFIK